MGWQRFRSEVTLGMAGKKKVEWNFSKGPGDEDQQNLVEC